MGTKTAESLFAHLCRRHPELSGESWRVVSSSLQNIILIVGERLVFRFPLTSDTSSMKLEMRMLPKLERHLPLPIPQFRYTPGRKDKLCYVGYPIIAGEPLSAARLGQMQQQRRHIAAQQIADFLTALHGYDRDAMTRVDPKRFQADWRRGWAAYYRSVEQHVFPNIERKERLWIMHVFYEYLHPSDHFRFTPCLLHGDFKNDHIFHDPQTGRLTGIIDFGSLRMGDPAYDFHDLCLAYGEPFARAILELYKGPADRTFWRRVTRFYAHIIRFSSLVRSVQRKDWNKFALRLQWLKEKARELDD